MTKSDRLGQITPQNWGSSSNLILIKGVICPHSSKNHHDQTLTKREACPTWSRFDLGDG